MQFHKVICLTMCSHHKIVRNYFNKLRCATCSVAGGLLSQVLHVNTTAVSHPLSDFQGHFNPAGKSLQSRCAKMCLYLLVL